ncbi:hypothetical protein QUF51_07845 [Bacillus pumilus]|nr:hypothetical protein [Bacillus pumilus]
MGWWIAIAVVLIVGWFLIKLDMFADKEKIKEDNIRKKLLNHGIKSEVSCVDQDFRRKIVLDEANNRFIIYEMFDGNRIEEQQVSFEKIIKSEIFFDDNAVTKVSRGGQVSGALVGGLVGGGVGAIIGGLSSSTTQTKTFKSIDLKLTVEDFNNPIVKFPFMPTKNEIGFDLVNGLKAEDPKVKLALENVEKWQGILEVAIRKASKVAQ